MPLNKNKAKIQLDRQLRQYWDFIKLHKVEHNLTPETFGIIASWKMAVGDKTEKAKFPDKRMICPVAVYNDRSLSVGGRFYGCFWIGMPSEARRFITIDGELTADIDGKSMHVQLLYKEAGLPVPDAELYIYPKSDPRRKIAKNLMLYAMNTRKKWKIKQGRIAVIRTYKKHHKVPDGTNLMKIIMELEKLHEPILHLLYQSNWGRLQCTEAGIMLKIMLAAMKENILVLPVHDGCLCQQKHKARVLELFADQGILAEENKKHLEPLDLDKMRVFYDLEQKEIELKKQRQIELKKQRQKTRNFSPTFSVEQLTH